MKDILGEFYLVCTIINNLSILCIVYVLARGYFYRKVRLSVGSFRIRRKDFTVQNITNIVSMKFYNGGEIPAAVRKEILTVTCPYAKNLERNDVSSNKSKRKNRHHKQKNTNKPQNNQSHHV